MAHLARMVAEAATAVADAPRAATQASASNAGGDRRNWYRLIPRRSGFASSDKDQEVSQWRDWYWGLRQYWLAIDGRYEEDRQYVEKPDINEVDRDLLDDDD